VLAGDPSPRALRVLLPLTVVTVWLGFATKAACLDPQRWTGSYQYTRLCYTDVYALWYASGLDRGAVPYADSPVEYPVGIGALMHAARLGVDLLGLAGPAAFLTLTTAMLTGAAVVVTWTTARLAGPARVWDAALVAAAPLLVLHGITNWDLAAVALAGAGLLAWARSRPVLAGVLLGLGGATKLYPLLLLLVLLLLCWRAGRLRPWLSTAAAAAGTLVAVVLPAFLLARSFEGRNALLRFVDLNRERPADWDSLWRLAAEHLRGGEAFAASTLSLGVAAALVTALAAVAALVLLAPRRPRVAQVAFLVVTAFLLTSKVHSPQFALWLLPLAALAHPSWRLLLAWQATEIVLTVTRFLYFVSFDDPTAPGSDEVFSAAVVLRTLALLGLCAVVARDVWRPEHDPVRAGGLDDPAGGPVAGVPDARPPLRRQRAPAP
jgi:uncharacterized membrane protein